jgi:hypothetical protein
MLAVLCVCSFGLISRAAAETVYSNGFGPPQAMPEWNATGVSPLAVEQEYTGNWFLGRFHGDIVDILAGLGTPDNRTDVTLRLMDLPPHAFVTVSFDLFVIGSWDGNDVHPQYGGPDLFELAILDGPSLVTTTFALCDPARHTQAYPDDYPATHPAATGAVAVNSLWVDTFDCGVGLRDAVYHVERTFAHDASSLALRFSGVGLQWWWDESWGLDNVEVEVVGPGETPTGHDVPVYPSDPDDPEARPPLELTFDDVSSGGMTTVTTTATGQPPPMGFRLGNPPVYYDLSTTAQYTGAVDVCVTYDDSAVKNESMLRLLHRWDAAACEGREPGVDPYFDYTQTGWENATAPNNPDTVNNVICGTVTCLSPFTLAEVEITAPPSPAPVSTQMEFSAASTGEAYATWTFGDGTPPLAVTSPTYGGYWVGSHTYATAGVYTVELTLHDATEHVVGSAEYRYAVVFDPAAGFVTGGGWIESRQGALVAEPTLTGKANFGFVAKYARGATVPDGNTEFQFKAGTLDFHSTSYDWLVVSGAKAMFKGVGTVNGEGAYKFQLSGLDAELRTSDAFLVDRFRIKIWTEDAQAATETVVYDNAVGSDADTALTEIGGGAITIHAK